MRKALLIGAGLLIGGGLWWLGAAPAPQSQQPSTNSAVFAHDAKNEEDDNRGPKITWSVEQLKGTMFPGTSSTTSVTFRSSENLTNVTVEATSSLKDILSVSPTSFSSISANQNYQLVFILKAPSAFKKREFEGDVKIRNNGKASQPYDRALGVNLKIDFAGYKDSILGVSLSYPALWTSHAAPNRTYFTAPPNVVVLEVSPLMLSNTPLNFARKAIQDNNCPALDSNGNPVDHIINASSNSVLFVLSCSATTDDYRYVFVGPGGRGLDLTYHDDFDSAASEGAKISVLEQVIRSMGVN